LPILGKDGIDLRPEKSEDAAMRPLGVSLLLLCGCAALENRFVYFPTKSDPRAMPAPLQEVALKTADGLRIHAGFCEQPQANRVLLYCHGNAGNLEQRASLMCKFRDTLECSVLIFDYPGYGRSEGQPSEEGCYAAAEAAYHWLTREQGIAPEHIIICGESLGGGVAVELASKRPHQALVLIRTFTSVPDIARQNVLLSSAPMVMVNRFNSLKRIGQCRSPIFIAQADHDRMMPFAHGEQLRGACKAPVQLYRLRGLDHNDPLPAEFFEELRNFLAAPKTSP
jgi:pimeloyl-ACP methyl ester carboxylesterase